jgi:hypothetical protein
MKVFHLSTALLLLVPFSALCGPTNGIVAESPNNGTVSTFTVNDETPFSVSGFHTFTGVFMPGVASTNGTLCDPPYVPISIGSFNLCMIESGVFPDFFGVEGGGGGPSATTCSVGGTPYTEPDQIIDGIRWSFKRNGTVDIATRPETNGGDPIPADIFVTGTMESPGDVVEWYPILCTTNAGLLVRYGALWMDTSYTTSVSINLQRTTQISIPQQPGFIRGRVDQPVSAPFSLSIVDPWEHAYRLSWTVGQPCSDWEPVLRLPSGTELNPGTGEDGEVSHGNHNLIATFTPTSLGAFTCYGTVTVSED